VKAKWLEGAHSVAVSEASHNVDFFARCRCYGECSGLASQTHHNQLPTRHARANSGLQRYTALLGPDMPPPTMSRERSKRGNPSERSQSII
jgi:hypothetical protein